MYWNYPGFEAIRTLCTQIALHGRELAERIRALDTDEAKWGEVRSFSTHIFTGAEPWVVWERFFEGWSSPESAQAAIDYLARAWQVDEPGIDGLRHEFKYRVIKGFIGQLRAQFELDEILLPPVSADALTAWEAEREVELPQYLRRLLTELSAGYDLKDEQMLFDFHDESFFTTHRVHMEEGHMDEQPWYPEALKQVLWRFERSPEQIFVELPQHWEQPAPKQLGQVADSMVLVEAYFEGNHGDNASYVITQGPLTGRVMQINNMYHAGEEGEGCVFVLGPHIADWLEGWFFGHVLGEDLW